MARHRSDRPKQHAVYNTTWGGWELSDDVVVIGHRQQQFMRLLAHGYSYKELAKTMGISVKTVSAHSLELQAKFGINGSRKLMVIATELYPRRGKGRPERSTPRKTPRAEARGDAVRAIS